MLARLKEITFTGDGKQLLTVITEADLRPEFDALKDSDVDVVIKKHRARRSLDANARAWVMIDRLSQALNISKTEVYRQTIRDIGGVSETVCVRSEGVDNLVRGWTAQGLGWQADITDSKLDGCKNVVLYYGSSVYDSKQMAGLIDHLVEDCKSLGIPVESPDELARLKATWADG